VSFVGSTPIAKYIYETGAAHGKRVQALGGRQEPRGGHARRGSRFAADAIIGAGYGSAGERCMAISAVVAVGDAGDALVEKLAARARAVTVGPGDAKNIEMGPVITCAARDRIVGLIDRGVAEGAKLVVDGRRPAVPGHDSGFFVGPTLFDGVTHDMAIYREEIFGPVLGVTRSESLSDAIALINGNPYANGAALFTRSGHACAALSARLSKWAWPASTCRSPCRWRSIRSAAGAIRCSATSTFTARTACASTRDSRP
jgi:malonate-semialdehyde dehydrogenase (acetylating)/methylmalonate-semialdehyde dehydrogenase